MQRQDVIIALAAITKKDFGIIENILDFIRNGQVKAEDMNSKIIAESGIGLTEVKEIILAYFDLLKKESEYTVYLHER